ncbi:MAG TPA: hypothetical protein VL997_05470 [Dyella sp.]|nr:hypothetical protein [Dyella sp.]
MKHHALMRKTATRCGTLVLGAFVLTAGSFALMTTPAHADVSIGVSITVGSPPPPLPVYEQPPIPAVGYIWTPGYWAWDGAEYYWVPGTWVLAPFTGALWTPGYWGWSDGVYAFHQGYWGTHVGFYGGINYGYGYTGEGYEGGHWGPGGFYYNQSVNRITNVHVTNVYNTTVINNTTINRTSYNGGNGGITRQPTAQEAAYSHEQHTPPVAAQQQHIQMARQNPAMRASVNHGVPTIAATSKPTSFSGAGVVAAHNAPASAAELTAHPAPHGQPASHEQPAQRPALRSAGFAPHPNAEPGHESATPHRPENRPEPENHGGVTHAPRPEAAPVERNAPSEHEPPRPAEQPRPMQQPHPSEQPHPAEQPRPMAQPHPAPAAHPQERRPPPQHEQKKEEQHPPGG